MSEYVPFQHTAQPMGCHHLTTFASVELWEDAPPDVIVLGRHRYVLEEVLPCRTSTTRESSRGLSTS